MKHEARRRAWLVLCRGSESRDQVIELNCAQRRKRRDLDIDARADCRSEGTSRGRVNEWGVSSDAFVRAADQHVGERRNWSWKADLRTKQVSLEMDARTPRRPVMPAEVCRGAKPSAEVVRPRKLPAVQVGMRADRLNNGTTRWQYAYGANRRVLGLRHRHRWAQVRVPAEELNRILRASDAREKETEVKNHEGPQEFPHRLTPPMIELRSRCQDAPYQGPVAYIAAGGQFYIACGN